MRKTGGSAILSPAGTPRPRPRPERVPVLVRIVPDGTVEVYGPRDRLAVQVGHALCVEPPEEVLAEAYFEATLPRRFRPVFVPGNLLAIGHVRDCRTAEAELMRRWELDAVRVCGELRNQFRKAPR